MPYICDANNQKFGKYTPGTNIKIISKEKMRELKPKYLLVLIWSFRSEIIKQELSFIKNGGNLIFHLPKFHIINSTNYKKYINKDLKTSLINIKFFMTINIEGIKNFPLKIISDHSSVMHMLRNDNQVFETFGEIYFLQFWKIKLKLGIYTKKLL